MIRISSISYQASAYQLEFKTTERRSIGQRLLMSFKEMPHGSNHTFECSPYGPCVPCHHYEMNDDKYRCGKTSYRILLKCVESENASDGQNTQTRHAAFEISNDSVKPHAMLDDAEKLITSVKHRSLLDDSSSLKDKS